MQFSMNNSDASDVFSPALAVQSTPNNSSEGMQLKSNTINLPRKDAADVKLNSIDSYNGNYEGDSSMFGGLPKSDFSDNNEKVDDGGDPSCANKTILEDVYKRWGDKLKTPQRRQRRVGCKENAYDTIALAFKWLIWLIRFGFYYVMLSLTAYKYSQLCSRAAVWCRSKARAVLWWMTFFKGSDANFFVVILVGTPLVFVAGILGIILSMYCAIEKGIVAFKTFFRGDLA